MTNLIKMELYKLRHSVEFKVLLALTLILSVFLAYLLNSSPGTWQGHLVAALKDSLLGDILLCIFAGLFIGNEFSGKMINLEIISGHSRRNILLSKAISFLMGVGILITIYPAISVIVTLIFQGYRGAFSCNDFIYVLKALVFNFLIHLKGAGFLLLLGFLFKNNGKIISVAIVALIIKTGLTNILIDKYEATGSINRYFGPGQLDLILYNDTSVVLICKVIFLSMLVFSALLLITNLIFKNLELR